jgi:hypothetical protein
LRSSVTRRQQQSAHNHLRQRDRGETVLPDGRRIDSRESAIAWLAAEREAATLEVSIVAKEHADRPKDHEALPELRALRDAHPSP